MHSFVRVRTVGIVAIGDVEKTIDGMEKHAAAVVPHATVVLLDDDEFAACDRDAIRIKREAREAVDRILSGVWPRCRIANHRDAGPRVIVPDEHVAICPCRTAEIELRMKRQPEQALLAATGFDRAAEVEERPLDELATMRDPNAATLFDDKQPVTTVGWLAQWVELLNDSEQKIARPRQVYIGSPARDYTAIERRK